MRRTYAARTALAALVLLASACTPSEPASDGGGPPGEEAELAHAECMRERGYDWPDPEWVDGSWNLEFGIDNEIDFESPQVQADEAECREQSGGAPPDAPADDPADRAAIEEEMERMLQFAACMRDQGIDHPDPELDENGEISQSMEIADEAAFDAAQQACGGGPDE